jgi:hypothetical protein
VTNWKRKIVARRNFAGNSRWKFFDKKSTCGITLSMTSTKLVSVKVPLKIFRAMPGAHKGRSRFIISALEDKVSRQRETEWRPKPVFERRRAEVEFYNAHFDVAETSASFSAELGDSASALAKNTVSPRWMPYIWLRPFVKARKNSSPANCPASRCSA